MLTPSSPSTVGLSPRLRGSGQVHIDCIQVARVIPAPAGIGFVPSAPMAAKTGYPRACGDRSTVVGRLH